MGVLTCVIISPCTLFMRAWSTYTMQHRFPLLFSSPCLLPTTHLCGMNFDSSLASVGLNTNHTLGAPIETLCFTRDAAQNVHHIANLHHIANQLTRIRGSLSHLPLYTSSRVAFFSSYTCTYSPSHICYLHTSSQIMRSLPSLFSLRQSEPIFLALRFRLT